MTRDIWQRSQRIAKSVEAAHRIEQALRAGQRVVVYTPEGISMRRRVHRNGRTLDVIEPMPRAIVGHSFELASSDDPHDAA